VIRYFVNHPVATWMIFTALIITGAYSLPRLDIEAMPEIELPSLIVFTNWNGASPKAIQRSITIPIEQCARRLSGVEDVTSRSAPGYSRVQISFKRDVDIEFARLELAEQLGGIRRNLPPTASQPVVMAFMPQEFRTEEFFSFGLISPLSTNELRDKAEIWLVPRLLSLPGVAGAEVRGGARPVYKILLDTELMERYSLTADEVSSRLRELDEIVPAGAVRKRGEQLTVSVQDSVTLSRLAEAVICTIGGQSIELKDIAELRAGFEDPRYFVRINGENVVQAIIDKRSGENAVGVSRAIRSALPGIEQEMPFPVKFEVNNDQGDVLENKLTSLVYRSLVILALLFIMLAIALRRVRLTAIVVASILLAIVICLSMFYFFDISVNFITISGLTVCFGMLLDNSILVLDAIHRRLTNRNGESALSALATGTHEVAFPIIATTLTTLAAFLSFTFLSGRLSLYYQPLAAAVGIAMVASIFVAFAWIPVALRGPAIQEREQALRLAVASKPTGQMVFRRWLLVTAAVTVLALVGFAIADSAKSIIDHWVWVAGLLGLIILVGALVSFIKTITAINLRFWWVTTVLTLALFAGGFHVYQEKIYKGGFYFQQPPETLRLFISRPVGTDVVLTTETMKLFEAELFPLPDGIKMSSFSNENRAQLAVEFETEMLYTEYPELYRNKLILLAEELGGMRITISGFGDLYYRGGGGGPLGNSLVKITGYNSKVLDEICGGVQDRLSRNRRVRSVRLTSGEVFERAASDESVIMIKRSKLAEHNMSVLEVLSYLRRLLGVSAPWQMIVDGEDKRLQLNFSESETIEYDQVMTKTLTSQSGEQVLLSDLITLDARPVVGMITRENQRYTRQITWEYVGTERMRQRFTKDIVEGITLPYGFTAEDMSGQRMSIEEEEELKSVLWLTLLFILMVLAALFESFALPWLVLLSVPMALVGVVGLFWVTDSSFDSSAKIGLVLLFGIVVNNAILLINRFRLQLRERVSEEGFSADCVRVKARLGATDLWRLPGPVRRRVLREATCDGMGIQLRSILLPSGTTIAGLLPLVANIGAILPFLNIDANANQGRDIWENLALSSIGGLLSSTVLIITAIPALYWAFCHLGWLIHGLWHRLRSRGVDEAESPATN